MRIEGKPLFRIRHNECQEPLQKLTPSACRREQAVTDTPHLIENFPGVAAVYRFKLSGGMVHAGLCRLEIGIQSGYRPVHLVESSHVAVQIFPKADDFIDGLSSLQKEFVGAVD